MSDEDFQELRASLVQERLKTEELAQAKKEQERDFTRQLSEVRDLLEAEQQKNRNLKASYMAKQSSELAQVESQLAEAREIEGRLRAEIELLNEAARSTDIERRVVEVEALNQKLTEENRQLVAQQTEIAEAAVRTK